MDTIMNIKSKFFIYLIMTIASCSNISASQIVMPAMHHSQYLPITNYQTQLSNKLNQYYQIYLLNFGIKKLKFNSTHKFNSSQ